MSSILPIVVDIKKNEAERIRVAIAEFRCVATIDVRQWFQSRDDVEPRPTKKGLTVALRHLPALAEAMQEALTSARAAGLLADGQDGGE